QPRVEGGRETAAALHVGRERGDRRGVELRTGGDDEHRDRLETVKGERLLGDVLERDAGLDERLVDAILVRPSPVTVAEGRGGGVVYAVQQRDLGGVAQMARRH